MLNINLIRVVIGILAENGETRVLTLIKLINSYINSIKIREPVVFEHIIFNHRKISLPLENIVVDWGDGNTSCIKYHKYSSNNIYRIKIYNSEKNLIINDDCWPKSIVNFISIGRIGIISLRKMFRYAQLNFIIKPNWDTSKIIDMSCMFICAENFNRKIGDNWDTSNVTDMSGMFNGAKKFNQKIGDNWDTSKVTNMSYMFSDTKNFNQKIGDYWNTANVKNMRSMFSFAKYFNQKIGDNWDTSQVTDMRSMFYCAINFNQQIGDNWNTSQVVYMSYMFYGARKVNQKIGDNWDISNVTDMSYMFSHGTNFN